MPFLIRSNDQMLLNSLFVQVKWEAEAKETVKLSVDDRLREAMADEEDEIQRNFIRGLE